MNPYNSARKPHPGEFSVVAVTPNAVGDAGVVIPDAVGNPWDTPLCKTPEDAAPDGVTDVLGFTSPPSTRESLMVAHSFTMSSNDG